MIRLGDSLEPGSLVSIQLQVTPSDLEAFKKYEIIPEVIRLWQNDEVIAESLTDTLRWEGMASPGNLRFEVHGRFNAQPTPLVISAPLYVSDRSV